MSLTIRKAAEHTGLTAHTLRYYERIGLLDDVERGADGHRRYSETDLDRLKILICLRGCGMSIQGLLSFVALYEEGDAEGSRRRAMLEEQRLIALASIEEVKSHIAMIDAKIAYLDNFHANHEQSVSVPAAD